MEEPHLTAARLLAAASSHAEQDSQFADDGGAGLLVLALLAAGAGELDADQLNDAQAVFAGALAALEAFRASHADGEAGWAAASGLQALRVIAAENARAGYPPIADILAAVWVAQPEEHAQHGRLLRHLQLGPRVVIDLATATVNATEAAAMAAGMEALSWLLTLAPPDCSLIDDGLFAELWALLSALFGTRKNAEAGGAAKPRKGSKAAGRQGSQEQGLGALRGFDHAIGEAVCKTTVRQIASLLRSWGRLSRIALRHKRFLPEIVCWQAAMLMANADVPARFRMEGSQLLAGWHSALQDEAGKEGVAADGQQPCSAKTEQTLLALDVFMPLLVRAVSWALQPAHLDLLGLADGPQRDLKGQLLLLACALLGANPLQSGLRLPESSKQALAAAMPALFNQLVDVLRAELDSLPPSPASPEELRARCLAMVEGIVAGERVWIRGSSVSVFSHSLTLLGVMDLGRVPADDLAASRLLEALVEGARRHPDPLLVEKTSMVLVDKLVPAGRGVPALLPDASLDEFADLLAATAEGYCTFLAPTRPDMAGQLYGISAALDWIYEWGAVPEEQGAQAMTAVCRLIKAFAKLPGIMPPRQLWQLLAAAGHLSAKNAAALQALALADCDVGLEATIAMVALLRVAAQSPAKLFDTFGRMTWMGVCSVKASQAVLNLCARQPAFLESLSQKKADVTLLRALRSVPTDSPAAACAFRLLRQLAMNRSIVAARLLESGIVGDVLQPALRSVVDTLCLPKAPCPLGIGAACLAAELAWRCMQSVPGAAEPPAAEPSGSSSRVRELPYRLQPLQFGEQVVPDTQRFGFDWRHLVADIVEAALHLWKRALQLSPDPQLVPEQGVWYSAMAILESLGMYEARRWGVLEVLPADDAFQRALQLTAIGVLAARSLEHEAAQVRKQHEDSKRRKEFLTTAEYAVKLVEAGLRDPLFLKLSLAQSQLPQRLRDAAGLLERHFDDEARADGLRQRCQAAAEALAAAEARLGSAVQLKSERRQLCLMALGRAALLQPEAQQDTEQQQQAAALLAEQAAAALLAEEEAEEQHRQQAAEQRQAAAQAKRQQQQQLEAERRQREEAERQQRQAEEEVRQQQKAQAKQERRRQKEEEAAAARAEQEAAQRAAEQKRRQRQEQQQRQQQQEAVQQPEQPAEAVPPLPSPPQQLQQGAPSTGPQQQPLPTLQSALGALQLHPPAPAAARPPGFRPLPYRPPLGPSAPRQQPGPAAPSALPAMQLQVQTAPSAAMQQQQQPAGGGREECSVCLDAAPVAVAVPCGHRTMCAGCAALTWRRGVRECVICRSALQGLVVPGQGPVA